MGLIEVLGKRHTYLDTNVLIYMLEGSSAFGAELRLLLDAMDAGTTRTATSELSLAELLVKPLRERASSQTSRYEQFITGRPHFDVVPVSRPVILRAAALRAESALKLPDAIHAATALLLGCEVLLTNDRRISPVAGLQVLNLSEAVRP